MSCEVASLYGVSYWLFFFERVSGLGIVDQVVVMSVVYVLLSVS